MTMYLLYTIKWCDCSVLRYFS